MITFIRVGSPDPFVVRGCEGPALGRGLDNETTQSYNYTTYHRVILPFPKMYPSGCLSYGSVFTLYRYHFYCHDLSVGFGVDFCDNASSMVVEEKISHRSTIVTVCCIVQIGSERREELIVIIAA